MSTEVARKHPLEGIWEEGLDVAGLLGVPNAHNVCDANALEAVELCNVTAHQHASTCPACLGLAALQGPRYIRGVISCSDRHGVAW